MSENVDQKNVEEGQQPERMLSTRVARVLTEQELLDVSGGSCATHHGFGAGCDDVV